MKNRWFELFLISFSVLLALSVWFSATSVLPALTKAFHLTNGEKAWLTSSVQLGFIVGALISAFWGWQDRWSNRTLFYWSSFVGAFVNLFLIAATHPGDLILIRFITGICLAGVYPTAVKLLSDRFVRMRALAIGILVGALSLGSAFPHLLNGIHFTANWKILILSTSVLSVCAGLIVWLGVREDPRGTAPSKGTKSLQYGQLKRVLKNRNVMLTNFGYFGHMWELYAMWTWVPTFIHATFKTVNSELLSFGVIGLAGFCGAVLGGIWAKRIGKIKVTLVALSASAGCCLLIVWVTSVNVLVALLLVFVWGFFVIMDSAQFSATVADFSEADYVGTAVTFQMAIGYLITIVTINLLPEIVHHFGWTDAFVFLSVGPVVGFVAMLALKKKEESDLRQTP